MARRLRLPCLLFCALLAGPAWPLLAAADAQAPPWLVSTRQFLMVVLQADAAQVQPLLPAGLEAEADGNGKVNLGLEVYATRQVNGIPAYQIAFLTADVRNQVSRDGSPGRFALWGQVDDPTALAQFQQVYGFPYERADGITLDLAEGKQRGVVDLPGDRRVAVQIEPLADQPVERVGAANMLAVHPAHGLIGGVVPYFFRGNAGRLVSLEVTGAGGDPALTLLRSAQPVFSVVSVEQTFTYGTPVAAATPAPVRTGAAGGRWAGRRSRRAPPRRSGRPPPCATASGSRCCPSE
jgi:hypothetical protein